MYISLVALPLMKYAFFASLVEINGIFQKLEYPLYIAMSLSGLLFFSEHGSEDIETLSNGLAFITSVSELRLLCSWHKLSRQDLTFSFMNIHAKLHPPGLQIRGGKGYISIDFLEFSIEN